MTGERLTEVRCSTGLLETELNNRQKSIRLLYYKPYKPSLWVKLISKLTSRLVLTFGSANELRYYSPWNGMAKLGQLEDSEPGARRDLGNLSLSHLPQTCPMRTLRGSQGGQVFYCRWDGGVSQFFLNHKSLNDLSWSLACIWFNGITEFSDNFCKSYVDLEIFIKIFIKCLVYA